jgi:hypothetical protein
LGPSPWAATWCSSRSTTSISTSRTTPLTRATQPSRDGS